MTIKRKRRYPSPDDQRRQFFAALDVRDLRGEWLITASVTHSGTKQHHDSHPWACAAVRPGSMSKLVESLVEKGAEPYIAVSTQLERPEPPKRGRTGTAGHLLAFYLDIDFKDATVKSRPLDAVQKALRSLTFGPPTMIVASGNGVHAWYVLDEPLDVSTDDRRRDATDALRAFNAAVAVELKPLGFVPDRLYDLPRLLRVPGSYNLKRQDSPLDVTLLECDPSVRFRFDDLRELSERIVGRPGPPPRSFAAKRRKRGITQTVDDIDPTPINLRRAGDRVVELLDEPPGEDRSAQVWRAAGVLLEEGMTDGQAKYILSEHYQPAIDRGYDDDVNRVIHKLRVDHDHAGKTCRQAGCRQYRSGVPPELAVALDRFVARVEKRTDGARNRNSQIEVAKALTEFARKAAALEFDASQRDIANEAGVARPTADKALKSLERSGCLERVGERLSPCDAQRYRIPSFTTGPRHPHVRMVDGCGPQLTALMHPWHDAWAFGGLNKSGHRLFLYLVKAPGPVEVDDMTEALGTSPATLRRLLRKFAELGAVRRTPTGWTLTDDAEDKLINAPQELGTTGRDSARRHRHEWESYYHHADHGIARPRPDGNPPDFVVRRRGPKTVIEAPTSRDRQGTAKRKDRQGEADRGRRQGSAPRRRRR